MNHNGNFGLLPELIRQASFAGANIAKFQLGWRDGEGEINRLTNSELKIITDSCDYYEIEPMFSIISDSAFDMIKSFPYDFKRYKVASRTVTENPSLVKKILSEGKETFVSLGFWNKQGLPFPIQSNLNYLFCVSKYPSLPNDLKNLPKDFSKSPYIGYSDHSIGIEAVLLSVSRGARVIEKHFTLDKSDTTIRDHALSATPDEFQYMVRNSIAIERLISLGV